MRCDSHVHIVGPPDRYPQVPERTYLAGVAPLDELKRRGAPHGITRFVIVQPSFYGFDNSATLDALDALDGNGRGVAVIDPNAHIGGGARRYASAWRAWTADQSLQPARRQEPDGGQLRRHRGLSRSGWAGTFR